MTIDEALQVFGMSRAEVIAKAQQTVDLDAVSLAVRQECLRRYRKLAMELHPDRGGDGEQMARLNQARDAVRELRLQRQAPPQVVIQWAGVTFTFTGGGYWSPTNATSTSWR